MGGKCDDPAPFFHAFVWAISEFLDEMEFSERCFVFGSTNIIPVTAHDEWLESDFANASRVKSTVGCVCMMCDIKTWLF